MKVMVSKETVFVKKENETKPYVHLETIIQGFFTLALAFLLLSQVKSCEKKNLGQALQLTSEDGEPDPCTIL